MEQALLVLQACDIIVGGPSMLSLSPERCRALGLVWTTADHCPEVIVLDLHEASADQVIAAIAPRL